MKVIYHEDFKESYCSDPAAAMEGSKPLSKL